MYLFPLLLIEAPIRARRSEDGFMNAMFKNATDAIQRLKDRMQDKMKSTA